MSFIEHIDIYDNTQSFPLHKHAACEINCLLKGKILIECCDKTLVATGGTIIFIPSNLPHKATVLSDEYVRELIFFSPSSFNRKLASSVFSPIILGLSVKSAVCAADDFSGIKLAEEMRESFHNQSLLSEDTLCADLSKILIGLISHNKDLCSNTMIKSRTVKEALKYISENCCEKIHIAELAESYHMSKFYFTHIFKTETGMSPREFLTRSRLSVAHKLLYDTDLTIAQIAEQCSFTSPSDLARKFHEEYNITPSTFRKSGVIY